MRRTLTRSLLSALGVILLGLSAGPRAQDQRRLLGTAEIKKGTWTGQLACYSQFRASGAAAASASKAQDTVDCVKKGGQLDWLGILLEDEGFAKIVGEKAAKNYEGLYSFVGKKVQVTGSLAFPNQYARGLPPEITVDRISIAK